MAIFTAIAGIGSAVIAGAGALGVTVGASALTVGAATVGAAAGAYGVSKTVKSAKQATAAVQAQTRAVEVQQKQQAATETRQRRQAIRSTLRAFKSQQAQRRAGAADAVSGFGGFRGSLFSQLGANLGFSTMMSGLSAERSAFTQQASLLGGQAQYSAALGGLGFQFGKMLTPSLSSLDIGFGEEVQ